MKGVQPRTAQLQKGRGSPDTRPDMGNMESKVQLLGGMMGSFLLLKLPEYTCVIFVSSVFALLAATAELCSMERRYSGIELEDWRGLPQA